MHQWWLVYVRWPSGRRGTIRTQTPDNLQNRGDMVVLACLPEPHITTRPGK
jgi:hypothetical protein